MVSVRAIGLKTSDPQRAEVALFALRDVFAMPSQADGYGMAAFIDDSILQTRVSAKAAARDWADHLSSFKCSTALLQIYQSSNENGGPFRLRQFAATILGGPQKPEDMNESREQLLSGVPDFLRRMISGKNETEAFFYRLVAECYQLGGMDNKYPSPQFIVNAIENTMKVTKKDYPRQVLFATGQEIVHFAHRMPSAALTIQGLSLEIAEKRAIKFVESAILKERLRQFKAVLTLGGLDEALKNDTPLPPGMTLKTFPESAKFAIGRDFSLQIIY